MTALLADLRARGFRLWLEGVSTVGPDAAITAHIEPASKLTADDKAQLREHREGILDLLHHEIPAQCEPGSEWGRPWRYAR